MNAYILRLVERVLTTSDRARPADTVLRETLKSQRRITPEESSSVSHLVFSYYRWRGWLDQGDSFATRIQQAHDLAARFADEPASFADPELIQRTVPFWIHTEMPVSAQLARALQAEPQLWLRARPGQGSVLAQRLGDCQVLGNGGLSDTLAYQGRLDLFRSPEFHAGAFELQDISSQAVSWLCAPEAGQTWWDACAGEGGKLLHLADLMHNQGLIWASDRAEWRLRRLKRRTARAKVFNYRSVLWDGGQRLPTKTRFDGILVDAPCTGTGTWQRNPHARWTLAPDDVAELAQAQLRLLVHVAAAVKPGGKLVYSACSLTRSETLEVVQAFEREVPGFSPLRLANPMRADSVAAERLFLWPHEVKGNGMFVAAWRREKP